jgi:hypothetical protein
MTLKTRLALRIRAMKLTDAVSNLAKASGSVDATLRAAEEFLGGLNLGFSAFVKAVREDPALKKLDHAESDDLPASAEQTFIHFSPVGERFRIAITKELWTMADGGPVAKSAPRPSIPWDQATPQERFDAVRALPLLFDDLAERVNHRADETEQASATVDRLLEYLRR